MTTAPITVDLPHQLGAVEAKRRIGANIGSLTQHLPAGADVRSSWEGETLKLKVGLMGQQIAADIEVRETLLHLTVSLPPSLAFFGNMVEGALTRSASQLLSDNSGR